jgi:hypothetical protein
MWYLKIFQPYFNPDSYKGKQGLVDYVTILIFKLHFNLISGKVYANTKPAVWYKYILALQERLGEIPRNEDLKPAKNDQHAGEVTQQSG